MSANGCDRIFCPASSLLFFGARKHTLTRTRREASICLFFIQSKYAEVRRHLKKRRTVRWNTRRWEGAALCSSFGVRGAFPHVYGAQGEWRGFRLQGPEMVNARVELRKTYDSSANRHTQNNTKPMRQSHLSQRVEKKFRQTTTIGRSSIRLNLEMRVWERPTRKQHVDSCQRTTWEHTFCPSQRACRGQSKRHDFNKTTPT